MSERDRYCDIVSLCRPSNGVRGCPHDGLGCVGGEKCSINSPDDEARRKAWVADRFGRDFYCVKRESRRREKPL